jgi:hypothetical protein
VFFLYKAIRYAKSRANAVLAAARASSCAIPSGASWESVSFCLCLNWLLGTTWCCVGWLLQKQINKRSIFRCRCC